MSEIITVSYSEIKRWRFCRQSHFYQYVEGIIPRVKTKPLKLGSIAHQSIEAWAKVGNWGDIRKAVEEEYKKMFEEEQELYGNIPETIKKLMNGYTSRYHDERKKYTLIEEKLGPVPLTKRTQFILRIDRLTETKAGLTLCETKTARRIPEEDLRIWDLQTILYVWALRELGYPVKAILWDYIRTKIPTVPQILKDGTISKRDIDTDYDTYLEAINKACPDRVGEYKDILKKLKEGSTSRFYKRVLLPVNDRMIQPVLADARMTSLEIASFSHIPVRNISGFTCPRCFYSSLCQANLRGLDESYIRDREFMSRKEEKDYGSEEAEEEE